MSNWRKLHVSKWQHAEWTCITQRGKLELVLNEGSDLEDILDSGSEENIVEDFLDSGSEENIVDSGVEFVPVDLEADSRDSDNNIFIFIIGIRATSRIKPSFFYCVWTVPALLLGQRKVYDMRLRIINLTSTHSKLSKNVYVYCIILVVYLLQFVLNRKKQCVYRSRVLHFVASWVS